MSIRPHFQKLLTLSLLLFVATSCVTIKPTNPCAVAGLISNGGFCANTQTGEKTFLTSLQIINMIEAKPEDYPDPVTGVIQKAHGAAVIETLDDYTNDMTELEQACRYLGSHCSNQIKARVESWKAIKNE